MFCSIFESSRGVVHRRPAVLLALGRNGPPDIVQIGVQSYRLARILKHDSWAATGLYEGQDGRVICKFNRQESAFGIPMGWLGRRLATREANLLACLAHTGRVPRLLGTVTVNGLVQAHAVAHDYVPGHHLVQGERVDDRFFPALATLVEQMHRCEMAYVDLHKRDNVIVGDDGLPYMVDFQISLALPRRGLTRWLLRPVLPVFQACDHYHLLKHWSRHRPDQCRVSADEIGGYRPWAIRIHRLFAVPLRSLRRRLLVALGIRTGRGEAATECDAH